MTNTELLEMIEKSMDAKAICEKMSITMGTLRRRHHVLMMNERKFIEVPGLFESDNEVELNGRTVPFAGVMGRNISPCSTTGIPGLVVPAGLSGDGLPISVELDGPAGSDARMLELGLAVEAVLGHLPPPA